MFGDDDDGVTKMKTGVLVLRIFVLMITIGVVALMIKMVLMMIAGGGGVNNDDEINLSNSIHVQVRRPCGS